MCSGLSEMVTAKYLTGLKLGERRVLITQPGAESNIVRFAALMRRLAEDNNGSFVGLSSLH